MIDLCKIDYRIVCLSPEGEQLDLTPVCTDLGWEEGAKELAVRTSFKIYNGRYKDKYFSESVQPGTPIYVYAIINDSAQEVARGFIEKWTPTFTNGQTILFGINDSRFGYPISRKIIWGTDEPDELFYNLQSTIIDKYQIVLPFSRLDNFNGKWQFGARDAPVDSKFCIQLTPSIKEDVTITENQNAITKITAILQEVYPLPRAKFFNGMWQFASAWLWGDSWLAKFGDVKFNPFDFIPLEFWGFDKNFGDDWRFNQLPPAEAFFSEDDVERLHLNYDKFSTEVINPVEQDTAQIKINLNDNILSKDTWADKSNFKSIPIFGDGQIYFQKPPDFNPELNFNASWAFGSTERFFDSNWYFAQANLCYSDDWHFDGEDYFESKQIEESFSS